MRAILTTLLALIVVTASAQLDRSQPPKPAPAKEIKIGKSEKFELKNGLKVIVVENDKLPTIGWTLTFDTGTITEGDKGGYAGMFGQVLRAGTTSMSKEVLDEEIDFIGASVNAGYGSISAFSLSKYKENVLGFMSDILLNPAFPQEELERAKKQTISALTSSKDDPNSISSNVSSVVNYGRDHTFGELITEETLSNVTMEDLKNHYSNYFKPNIATLVVVGDIKKKDAQKLAKKYFGSWEKGEVNKEVFENPKSPEKTTIAFVDRPSSVQSVINITYPVDNKPGNSYATKLSLLDQILGGAGGRLFNNLREDKGYTYGAYSDAGSNRYSAEFSAGASVRNEVTDSALVEFMYELERIRTELIGEEEIQLAKNYLKGSFARSLESRSTVASFALNTQLNNLPEDYYSTYLKRLDAITAQDLLETAQKFIRPDKANIVVVGKAEAVAEKLKRFGEIRYYDEEGNPVDDPTKVVISEGVSADGILSNFIEKIGGKSFIDGINTLEYTSKATLNFGGQSIDITRTVYQKSPDKFLDLTVIPAMGETKQYYTAGSAKMIAQGQTIPLQGPQLVAMKYLGVLYGERFYTDLGYTVEYKGLKKVDGKDAHRVDLTLDGVTISEFYDVASGLKVQADLGPSGLYTFSDYREVDGLMIAHKLVVKSQQLPVPLELVIEEVKVNQEIDDSLFN